MIACICEQGAKIRREGERLVVKTAQEEKTLFAHQLEQLLLFGNIHLTAQARSLLLARRIDTVFLSVHGSYRGRLATVESENVFLRKRQYELLTDEEFKLETARAIVLGKLHNQAVMLGRLKREHHVEEAQAGAEQIKALAKEAKAAASIESLRGMEGAAAEAYFHYFAKAYDEGFNFRHRVRRPPTDPVNAVLSFIYTLLADQCHTACRLAGLDPYPGNLHALEYGRYSLPLDLMEEFRAIIGDTLTFALFSKHMLMQDDFEAGAGEDSDIKGVLLRREALKKVLAAFVRKLASEFRHDGREISYSHAIRLQAEQYRDLVEGKIAAYKPVMWH